MKVKAQTTMDTPEHSFTTNVSTDMNITTDLTNPLISWGKDKYGYYVEFEEGVWENAELTEIVDGYPIFVRRTF